MTDKQKVKKLLPKAIAKSAKKISLYRIIVGKDNTMALAASSRSLDDAWRVAALRLGL